MSDLYMSESTEINDKRQQKDFRGITFSGFNKAQVKKELLNNLTHCKIEPSIYWSAEFICAGHFNDIWEIILYFYSNHVHNPKLATFIDLRFQTFKDIVKNGYIDNEIRMRNNSKIRKLFCEIICILCYSKRKHCFQDIKIKPEQFDLTQMEHMFKAPNVSFGKEIYLEDDPKELFIAVNELAYNLSNDGGKNAMNACYWIEWIIQFESACNSRKEYLKCQAREKMPVMTAYQKEVIWIVWSALLKEAGNRHQLIKKIVDSLLNLFTLKYTSTCSRKRKYILFFVVQLLVENVSLNDEIIRTNDKEQLAIIIGKIDNIYGQIKENEHSPNTDYLFLNKKSDNLDKTIKKIETMNSFGATFIPRI